MSYGEKAVCQLYAPVAEIYEFSLIFDWYFHFKLNEYLFKSNDSLLWSTGWFFARERWFSAWTNWMIIRPNQPDDYSLDCIFYRFCRFVSEYLLYYSNIISQYINSFYSFFYLHHTLPFHLFTNFIPVSFYLFHLQNLFIRLLSIIQSF